MGIENYGCILKASKRREGDRKGNGEEEEEEEKDQVNYYGQQKYSRALTQEIVLAIESRGNPR